MNIVPLQLGFSGGYSLDNVEAWLFASYNHHTDTLALLYSCSDCLEVTDFFSLIIYLFNCLFISVFV